MSIKFGLLLCALVIAATNASAGPITFTEEVVADGLIGSHGFRDAAVSLTVSGDTSNVANLDPINGLFVLPLPPDTVSIFIDGTAAILADAAEVYANDNLATLNCPEVGFREAGSAVILGTVAEGASGCFRVGNPFDTYDLTTSAEIFGLIVGNPGLTYNTSLGGLSFRRSQFSDSLFMATAGASTPEPTTLALFGFGLTVLVTLQRRRLSARRSLE